MKEKVKKAKNVVEKAKDFIKDKLHQAKDFIVGKEELFIG
jgi:hypothetical protein